MHMADGEEKVTVIVSDKLQYSTRTWNLKGILLMNSFNE